MGVATQMVALGPTAALTATASDGMAGLATTDRGATPQTAVRVAEQAAMHRSLAMKDAGRLGLVIDNHTAFHLVHHHPLMTHWQVAETAHSTSTDTGIAIETATATVIVTETVTGIGAIALLHLEAAGAPEMPTQTPISQRTTPPTMPGETGRGMIDDGTTRTPLGTLAVSTDTIAADATAAAARQYGTGTTPEKGTCTVGRTAADAIAAAARRSGTGPTVEIRR